MLNTTNTSQIRSALFFTNRFTKIHNKFRNQSFQTISLGISLAKLERLSPIKQATLCIKNDIHTSLSKCCSIFTRPVGCLWHYCSYSSLELSVILVWIEWSVLGLVHFLPRGQKSMCYSRWRTVWSSKLNIWRSPRISSTQTTPSYIDHLHQSILLL